MVLRWSMQLAGAALLFLAADTAAGFIGPDPDFYLYEVLFDTDSNAATGCNVDAEDDYFTGPVPGIEYVLASAVQRFPTSAFVDEVRLLKCESGSLVPHVQVSTGDWPAGLENGIGGADVVEVSVPRSAIGDPPAMTLGFHSTQLFFNDVLLTTNGQPDGEQIVFAPPPRENVPALSSLGIGLTALLLVAIACLSLRRYGPAQRAVAMLALIVSFTATAWAVTIALDGNIADWATVAPIAMDQTNDSTNNDPAEDFVAAFVTADAGNLYFRMDLVNLAPVVCGNGVIESGEECEVDLDCDLGERGSPGSGGGAGNLVCLGCECDVD
jgi:hypothetical protein